MFFSARTAISPWRPAMRRACWAKALLAAALVACAVPLGSAQEMFRHLDLKSDDFTKADMTRAEIEAALAPADQDKVVDLSGRRLNGLDLSGLDLRRVKLQAARLNRTELAIGRRAGVTPAQARALDADLTGA